LLACDVVDACAIMKQPLADQLGQRDELQHTARRSPIVRPARRMPGRRCCRSRRRRSSSRSGSTRCCRWMIAFTRCRRRSRI
jgi:hypothetical protein